MAAKKRRNKIVKYCKLVRPMQIEYDSQKSIGENVSSWKFNFYDTVRLPGS